MFHSSSSGGSANNNNNNNNNNNDNRPSPQSSRPTLVVQEMDIETSTQSDSDSDHDSTLSQPFLRFNTLFANPSGRNHSSPSVSQQYAQLQLRRAAHRPYFSVTSAGGSGSTGVSGSRPSSRSSHITFGTLKKASMSSRPSSTPGTKAKLTVLPAYLHHTSFLDHFQPEGVPPPGSSLSSTGSSDDHESTKRRRLTEVLPYQYQQHDPLASHYQQATHHLQHFPQPHTHHHRRHHLRRSSDSSNSSSGSSSGSSGSESGHSYSSDHMNATGGHAAVSVVEERPPLKYQLPSRWSCTDKLDQMELAEDDLQVKYVGVGAEDSDAAAIRANRPIPPQCGIYYFEVYIKNKGRHGYIGVGVCNPTVNLARLPGWDRDSWGYHGDDGHSFGGSGRGKPYGPTFTTGDTVGCGVNFRDNTLFYTKNGVYQGIAFRGLKGTLYPTVGMRTPGEVLETNFGQHEFMFNIVDHVKDERIESWRQLEDSTQQGPPLQLEKTLPSLVLSYMVHHGYSESAKQFVQDLELAATTTSSSSSSSSLLPISLDTSKDKASTTSTTSTTKTAMSAAFAEYTHLVEDTVKRKAIRQAILEGDTDRAIQMLQESYQGMLDMEEDLMLQLQCRRFIEMVRRASRHRRRHSGHGRAHAASPSGGGGGGSSHHHLTQQVDKDHKDDNGMDLDEAPTTIHLQGKEKEKKHTSKDSKQKSKAKAASKDDDGEVEEGLVAEVDSPVAEELDMLAEAIEFGQSLQQQYKDDRRPIVQRMLVDAFSVLAYSDVEEKDGGSGGSGVDSSSSTSSNSHGWSSRHSSSLSREGVAEAVNLAILASQQQPTVAPLEAIYRQTKLTLEELIRHGVGSAAFFDVQKDCF
ncbi:hypothetical protein BGZ73_005647 [Actinomortierella ambigua]|nr:hypothetical protein BGZ73_005647 [Actinomortierella ambigua]